MKPLHAISTPRGIISALAIDQRKSLRRMIAHAAGQPESAISDAQLSEFKRSVFETLSPLASAILIDPEYGLDALATRAPNTGLLLTYEADGFDNPRPNRMLALLPDFSAARLRELGAHGVKILLSWAPDDLPAANDQKRSLIELIGDECANAGIPFLLEPVVYDPAGADPRGAEFARRKPALVRDTIEEFSKPVYQVDVLKVEFPVIMAHVGAVYSRDEALEALPRSRSGRPLPLHLSQRRRLHRRIYGRARARGIRRKPATRASSADAPPGRMALPSTRAKAARRLIAGWSPKVPATCIASSII